MHQLSSSFREVPLVTTLSRAQSFATKLGISRVTNITRLDCIGIPVYASIRPDAAEGSLCVNAGKGVFDEEAKVGALMEAIEFAIAEHSTSQIPILRDTARNVLDGNRRADAILDFCPILNSKIDVDLPLSVVEAEELFSQSTTLVPARLVFLPFKEQEVQDSLFPPNSNGLASGNSVAEATVHAILEVIERDISSFQLVCDTSRLVILESLPEPSASLIRAISNAGLSLYIRFMPNDFKLAHFSATILDRSNPNPLYINGGCGCHVNPSVALIRAICEAAQSRLSFIHGARDDLTMTLTRFSDWNGQEIQKYVENRIKDLENAEHLVSYEDLISLTYSPKTIQMLLNFLLEVLWSNNMRSVCRIVLTQESDPVQVVRVLIPQMENFSQRSNRLGIRLKKYVESI